MKDNNKGISVDLGCGSRKQPGFVGIDIRALPGVDIVQDLEQFPWPLPNESVSFMVSSHVAEHIDPAHGTFLRWMDECWRIMKHGGQFVLAMPYAGSRGDFQDPTHCNHLNDATWSYFDPLSSSGVLYDIYRPKPWKIIKCTYDLTGNMEVCLEKRRIDKTYQTNDENEHADKEHGKEQK